MNKKLNEERDYFERDGWNKTEEDAMFIIYGKHLGNDPNNKYVTMYVIKDEFIEEK